MYLFLPPLLQNARKTFVDLMAALIDMKERITGMPLQSYVPHSSHPQEAQSGTGSLGCAQFITRQKGTTIRRYFQKMVGQG